LNKQIFIRNLSKDDIPRIVDAFNKSNWTIKPKELLVEQNSDKREVWVAYSEENFMGYVTLIWKSLYLNFAKNNIPEICDLNVLPKYRNFGVGSALLDKCEKIAFSKSQVIGIGVGLYADYGSAQKIYVKRGYIPDGFGVTYDYKSVIPGQKYQVDDDFVLWFTKEI
jgi:GNAT superfamily N-acetyltransferase